MTQGPLDLWSQINFLDEYILQNSFYAYRNTFCVIQRRRLSSHSFDEDDGSLTVGNTTTYPRSVVKKIEVLNDKR